MERIQKFSPSDPAMTELRDRLRQDVNLSDLNVGKSLAQDQGLRLVALAGLIEDIGKSPAGSVQKLSLATPQVRELLASRLDSGNPRLVDSAVEFINVALEGRPSLKPQIQKWLANKQIPGLSGEEVSIPERRRLTTKFLAAELPPKLIQEAIASYAERIEHSRKHLLQNSAEWGRQFVERVESAVSAGRLPESALRAKEIVAGLQFRVVDGLFWGTPGFRNAANFSQASAVVALHALNPSREDTRRAFNHELVHAISGRTEQFLVEDGEIFGRSGSRLGLAFSGLPLDAGRSRGERFQWLNEAITESVNLELLGLTDSASYRTERAILKKLEETVPRAAFLQAYFENMEVGSAGPQPLPGWKELSAQLTSAYGTAFLVALDKCVDLQGPQLALRYLTQGPEAVAASIVVRKIRF
ncbi:MAG: hypothetical protein J0M12_10385 [Deltaproteobacteria bacterium]|nr:hypothetical protein [Deltaproteobacteria bacterium]